MSYSDVSETSPSGKTGGLRLRTILRRVVYPLAVIAVIIAVIWWLGGRNDAPTSPAGVRYGPAQMAPELNSTGLTVAAEEGALAPDFLLERLEGGDLQLSDFRGRPVVLNFWAKWCEPCRQEMPRLVESYNLHQDDGLVILGVNLQEGNSIVGDWVKDFGINFPLVVDRVGAVADSYRVGGTSTNRGLPTSIFIDRAGVIRSVFTGPFLAVQNETNVQGSIENSELEQRIAQIITPVPAPGGS